MNRVKNSPRKSLIHSHTNTHHHSIWIALLGSRVKVDRCTDVHLGFLGDVEHRDAAAQFNIQKALYFAGRDVMAITTVATSHVLVEAPSFSDIWVDLPLPYLIVFATSYEYFDVALHLPGRPRPEGLAGAVGGGNVLGVVV